VLQKAAGTLLFLTFMLHLLAMNIICRNSPCRCPFIDLQTTQEFGASPNVMPRQGSSTEVQMGPLHVALLFRQQECVSALLNHKLVRNLDSVPARYTRTDETSSASLFRGCAGRCLVYCLSSSLTCIYLQVRVDLPDSTGKTPMHVAAGIGYEWGVKALLDANADPSIKDKMNRSVVEYAEQKGKLICVQAITSIHEAVTCLQTQRDEVAQTAASPLEKAVKQAMNEDDAQQLYEVLQQHAKMGRIDLIIDNLYEGFKGRSCLHRYHRRKTSCVCQAL
jgi:ankyrin repeat protein